MSDELNSPPPPPAGGPSFSPGSAPYRSGPGFNSGYAQAGFEHAAPGFPTAYAGAPMYAPRKLRPAWFWPLIILGSLLVLGGLLWGAVWVAMRSMNGGATPAFNAATIAVIDLDGVIVDADKVDAQLRKFSEDDSVKAIILHINSPGGGAAASQEIYHEVMRIRQEKHKRIVASVESVGASGAYYIASACDRIYANEASVVGSIGVIMEWTNYGDLMRWAKLKSVVIHAGTLKDAGDPTHDMTSQEAAYFQSLVDNMYAQFIRDVADGRHLPASRIQPLATGQVWTGQQSLGLGLIDQLGGYRVALMDTARAVGIKEDEPAIVRPVSAKKGLAGLLNGDSDDLFPNPSKLLDRSPGFYFMWK